MISIKITGLAETQRRLGEIGRQARFAAAVALTKTGKKLEKELQDEMRRTFSGATPYTLKSQFTMPATKQNLTAFVGIKDIKPGRGTSPAVLLKEHFSGGARGNKPMEKALQARAALPGGYVVVPGAGIKLDRYGNPTKKQVAEILGALKAGTNVYSGRGKRVAEVGYFVVPIQRTARTRHLVPGIYQRINRGRDSVLRPMFLFVQRAAYARLFDLEKIGRKVVARDFNAIFNAELERAIRTAK